MKRLKNPERVRLKTTLNNLGWKTWGPYLSERQWGTVREDYSDHGYAWGYFTHDMARSRAYRWGEEGLGGICDNRQNLCFAFSLWNKKDPILKERLFGLSNGEGNHGEDVKEYYYYLDSTPTHSYMKMLYKYPINEFPYEDLVANNAFRKKSEEEYELIDTGIFDKDEYFDVFFEYAKDSEYDIMVKVTIENRSDKAAQIDVAPNVWFPNTWAWGNDDYKPEMYAQRGTPIFIEHREVGNYHLYYEGTPELLFCDNDTNPHKHGGDTTTEGFYKDGVNEYIINNDKDAVNKELIGTKAALRYQLVVPKHGSRTLRFRLSKELLKYPFTSFDTSFAVKKQEADIFYDNIHNKVEDTDLRRIQRQAYAGMLWSKQFYHYNVTQWLDGDPNMDPLPEDRKNGRNSKWRHLVNSNVISMPDKWEYPWYAAWDLAFHCIPLAKIDPNFAKRQLLLLLREYYMHPNGQIPAYEWSFSDVNPPVHAWGAWKVYSIDKEINNGVGDKSFLAKIFLKLSMNFTWWVNQKDENQNNLFEGGFLGLDNIGVFDRSAELPNGGSFEQADGTAWMAMYSLNMLRIAVELAKDEPYYQEAASKFFEHFLMIAGALRNIGNKNNDLWDDEDKFFYDMLVLPNKENRLLKVRSLVGLLPLFAVEVFSSTLLSHNPDFTRRLEYALTNRPDLSNLITQWFKPGKKGNRILALVRLERMKALLTKMLDESEFLSDYGIRALSKYHKDNPYRIEMDGTHYMVEYVPGESDSSMFGGNSNWRGPIWFPMNYLLVESLRKFHSFYGDDLKIEYPTGSGIELSLKEIADQITNRLINIFKADENGHRVVFGKSEKFQNDPHFRDNILFYEYFHGDDGHGMGASHQTGWTGLIADMIDEISNSDEPEKKDQHSKKAALKLIN